MFLKRTRKNKNIDKKEQLIKLVASFIFLIGSFMYIGRIAYNYYVELRDYNKAQEFLNIGKEEVEEIKKGVWINLVNPSESEIKRVCTEVNIEEDFIRYPLDYEEQARIDTEDDRILFVIDVPIIEDIQDDTTYTTMPLGVVIVRDDFFITVSLK